jgi:hypothetical protein
MKSELPTNKDDRVRSDMKGRMSGICSLLHLGELSLINVLVTYIVSDRPGDRMLGARGPFLPVPNEQRRSGISAMAIRIRRQV